ncbi:hypothetical protein ACLOJK_040591 [Asimina triloba]
MKLLARLARPCPRPASPAARDARPFPNPPPPPALARPAAAGPPIHVRLHEPIVARTPRPVVRASRVLPTTSQTPPSTCLVQPLPARRRPRCPPAARCWPATPACSCPLIAQGTHLLPSAYQLQTHCFDEINGVMAVDEKTYVMNLASDVGDATDAVFPFLVVLRRRSSCRVVCPLLSLWMDQILHLPDLVGATGRQPWLPSLGALVGSDGAPYLGAPVVYGLSCTFSC